MLYQLSYLGILGAKDRASGRFIVGLDPAVHPASPSASLGAARLRIRPQIIGKSRLFGVFRVSLLAGDDIGAGEPAVQVDVAAARGTKRQGGGIRGLAAFR